MRIILRLLRQRLDTPWTRVTLVFLCVATVTVIVGARVAKAQAGAALGTLAEQMLTMATPNPSGATQAVTLNGFELGLRVESVAMSRDDAIQMVSDECRIRGGMMEAPLDNGGLDALRRGGTSEIRNAADGILVEDTVQGTVVACIDTQGKSWLSREMLDQLKAFMASGELAEIGVVRYTLVRGNDKHATLVRMWSEGRAPILKMFPKEGDVPGNDHAFVPRVGGRRVLSARVANSSLVSYQHPTQTVDEVWQALEPALARADVFTKDMEGDAPGKRLWVKQNGTEALVTLLSVNGTTYLSVFDAP